MIRRKAIPGNLDANDFFIHNLQGSLSLNELFSPNTVITEFVLKDEKDNLKYGSVGESAYDSYHDIGNLAEGQNVKALRIKGYQLTGFGGKMPFDIIITCIGDVTRSFTEEVEKINSKILKLTSILEHSMEES